MHPGIRRTVVLALLVMGLSACRDQPPQKAVGRTSTPPQDAGYVGGDACMRCHEKETDAWESSDHRRAMQPATEATVLGNFDTRTVTHLGLTSTFFSEHGKYFVRTDGADGRLQDFPVEYTFGVRPLQQYLVRLSQGKYQALSLAWDSRPRGAGGERWFHLSPSARIDHRDVLHWTGPAYNWNYMCAECHSTAVAKNYSPASDRYETTWSEVNVSCEACHGPGSRHVEWATQGGDRGEIDTLKGLVHSLRGAAAATWTMQPGAVTAHPASAGPPANEVETCGRCHSRRVQLWPEYRHGQPLADTHRLVLLEEGVYEADGQILDEAYEYGSFIQSKMYRAGVTCSNCHDPHSGAPRLDGNALCTQCHTPTEYDGPSHHFHRPSSAAARCVSCHMPERVYMVVDGRRDHGFRIPRPDESARFGTPNACETCHARGTAQWAADAVARWYGSELAARPSFTQALDAGRRRRPEAVALLARLSADASMPGIARATAVALLPRYRGRVGAEAIERAAADADPLVRRAAAGSLPTLDPSARVRVGVPLLADPIRSVRLEAVLPMAAAARSLFTVEARRAFERAVAEFRQAQVFNADRPEALVGLGTLEAQLGRPSDAEAAYRAAQRREPRFVPAYLNLTELLRVTGRESEIEGMLRAALSIVPGAAELHAALGLALVRQARLAEALGALARATALAPGDPRHAFVYAVAVHDSGDRPAARQLLREAVARHGTDPDLLQALVSYAIEAADFAEALVWADQLAAVAPEDPAVQRQLAELQQRQAR